MRNDKNAEKLFNLAHLGVKIIAVILLVIYLGVYLKSKSGIFLSFVGPAVFFIIFLLYNRLLVQFHKKGLYTSWQASEFYRKCYEENISVLQEDNFEKAADIYFSIFGTEQYLGIGTLSDHMAEIYAAGKEITEKKR